MASRHAAGPTSVPDATGYEPEGAPPAGKRHPITSVESQYFIETGEWPDARARMSFASMEEDGRLHIGCDTFGVLSLALAVLDPFQATAL